MAYRDETETLREELRQTSAELARVSAELAKRDAEPEEVEVIPYRDALDELRPWVEGTLMAGGPMLVADDLAPGNPIKPVAQGYIKAYEAKYGPGTTSTFGANTWDAGLLLQKAIPEALKKAKAGTPEFRIALRDALDPRLRDR